jgi:hypothetical protein
MKNPVALLEENEMMSVNLARLDHEKIVAIVIYPP